MVLRSKDIKGYKVKKTSATFPCLLITPFPSLETGAIPNSLCILPGIFYTYMSLYVYIFNRNDSIKYVPVCTLQFWEHSISVYKKLKYF